MMFLALLARLQDPTATGAPAAGGPETPPPSALSSWMGYAPMIAIFAIFYFVMIAPERKNRKKRQAMLEAMKKGDKVMTTGGMFGEIVAMHDNEITLKLDENVRVKFSRQSIQEVLADGSSTVPAKH